MEKHLWQSVKKSTILVISLYPLTHFLVALFFSELFVYLGILSHKLALLAAVIAVLIDLDHLFAYLFHHGQLSIRKAWNSSTVKHEKNRTFIHHLPGFVSCLIIISILSLFHWQLSLALAIAYYSHILLDDLHFHFHKTYELKEWGFVLKIPLYELLADFVLVLFTLIILI